MPRLARYGRRNRHAAAVLLVVLIGLGFRLHTAWEVNSAKPNAPSRLTADEPGYDSLARGLLAGEGLTWPGRVPGYPVWLATLYWFTGGSYNEVLYVQAVVGALAVWLTYLLGRRLFGHGPGLLAALAAAVHFVLIQQSVRYLSEILFTPAVLIVVLALTRAVERASFGRFALVGIAIGAANLVRPTLFLFPLFLVVVLPLVLPWRLAVRAGAAVVLFSALVITPWMVRNYIRYDALLPLATSNAILWQGSPEYYRLIRSERYTYLQVWNEVIYGPGNEGNDPGTVEGERYWNRRALNSIRAEPHIYALFFVEKLGTYWVGDPNADWDDTFVFNFRALRGWGVTRAQTAQMMAVRALPIVGLVAIVVLRRRWRELLPVFAILAYCTLLHAATHAEARLSDPLQPLLLVLIAGAAALATGRLRDQRGPATSFFLLPSSFILG
jgi:4-amino-4-deoxy-L-arabinose transferase-like glycosyltransferase